MIVMVDLDNTLVDRAAAFDAWASSFVAEVQGDAADLGWLLRSDAAGYRPRADLAQEIIQRFQLSSTAEQLVDRLLHEHVELVELFPGVGAGLEALAADGAHLVVVSNGTVAQQTQKMTRTGLDRLVDHVVISGAVGAKKPERLIFDVALELARSAGAYGPPWMVGDHPVADIAGGRACGLRTGWVSHGATWLGTWTPDLVGRSTSDVLAALRDVAAHR